MDTVAAVDNKEKYMPHAGLITLQKGVNIQKIDAATNTQTPLIPQHDKLNGHPDFREIRVTSLLLDRNIDSEESPLGESAELDSEGGTGRRVPMPGVATQHGVCLTVWSNPTDHDKSYTVDKNAMGGTGLGEPTPLLSDSYIDNTLGGTGKGEPTPPLTRANILSAYPKPAPVSLALNTWKIELENDFDKCFLLQGIEYGFWIVDRVVTLHSSCRKNYRSVLLNDREKVDSQIKHEVSLGRYIVVDSRPSIVSSLGAVPKSDGSIRIIHDLSRPDGGINLLAAILQCYTPL